MNLKKSLILLVFFVAIFSYGTDKSELNKKETATNTGCNIKNVSELDKNILKKMCSFDAMYKVGISEKKAEDIKIKLCDLDLKEQEYCKKINKLAQKQLELLMDENLNEKEIYKLVDEIGDLKIKIAKLRIDAIIIFKKNFTTEQIKQLK